MQGLTPNTIQIGGLLSKVRHLLGTNISNTTMGTQILAPSGFSPPGYSFLGVTNAGISATATSMNFYSNGTVACGIQTTNPRCFIGGSNFYFGWTSNLNGLVQSAPPDTGIGRVSAGNVGILTSGFVNYGTLTCAYVNYIPNPGSAFTSTYLAASSAMSILAM